MNAKALQSFRLTARLALVLSLFLMLSAFRHTDVDAETNPAYVNYTFDAVFVQIPATNDYFREYVSERLAKEFRKSNVRMYTTAELFSPFRDWTEEEKQAVLAERGVTATIVISLESASERASNGTIFFDTNLGIATQVQTRTDRAVFHVRLIDVESKDLAWTAIVRTRGSGTLFTGDKSAAKAVSKKVVRSLRDSGHLLR